jgi:hypothetical protein
MRDNVNSFKIVNALGYAARTATVSGEVIDVQGYDKATIVVQVGTVTTADATNKFAIDLYHGDLASGTDATTVPAAQRIGSAFDIDASGDADKTGAFGYLGNKRYIRLQATESGTASVVFGATALLGAGAQQPSQAADLN